MRKNIKNIFIGLIGITAFSLLFYFSYYNPNTSKFYDNNNSDDNSEKDGNVFNLFLYVDYGNGTIDKWENFNLTDGKTTVFDALNKWCDVIYKIYPDNQYYVTYINGVGEGWIYEVNDVRPNVACNKYHLKNGDKIEWIHV